jgi:hypothetical protein
VNSGNRRRRHAPKAVVAAAGNNLAQAGAVVSQNRASAEHHRSDKADEGAATKPPFLMPLWPHITGAQITYCRSGGKPLNPTDE